MARRILKEERNYTLQLVKKIAKSGCNVLLIQKSILRDATSDLSLHFLVRLAGVLHGAGVACSHAAPVAMHATPSSLSGSVHKQSSQRWDA